MNSFFDFFKYPGYSLGVENIEMCGKIFLDMVLVKQLGCRMTGNPMFVLVTLQAESHKIKYIGFSFVHSALSVR